MNVLDHLIKEHREATDMVQKLKDSEPGEQRSNTITELADSLHTHMAVEERFIYPIVEEVMDDEERDEEVNEHDLIRQGLETLNEMEDEPGFQAALEMFETGLSHHVSDEEEEVFPELRKKADDRISQMDPDELEQAVEKGGGTNSDQATRDELYEKAKEQDVAGRSSMNKSELADAVDDS